LREGPAFDEASGETFYGELRGSLQEALREAEAKRVLRLGPLTPLLDRMIEEPSLMGHLFQRAVVSRDTENALGQHLIHVAAYALTVAKGIGWLGEELRRLGLVALIHDAGMCLIPKYIRHKEGPITEAEMALIRRHPDFGSELALSSLGREFQWLARVIAQEHERENRRGYPRGLRGEEVDDMAKVIGIADVYEAMTHHRPHRRRLLPFDAMREIMRTQQDLFSPGILRAALLHLSVFPLHSLVRLSSDAIARVVAINEYQPLRPTVEILLDPKGRRVPPGKVLSLREHPLLHVVESADEEKVPV
jgi:HD-GYP domain-containing protein (c-di-GMP phosphodiesterase class II)